MLEYFDIEVVSLGANVIFPQSVLWNAHPIQPLRRLAISANEFFRLAVQLTNPFDNTDLPRSPGGLIKANAFCQAEGMDKVYVVGDSGSFPGPEWMPKQAHMADLQAGAAAANLLSELAGRAASQSFKVELVCIIDSLNSGMLVARTEKHNFVLPPMLPLHWAKRFFEWMYLRKYR